MLHQTDVFTVSAYAAFNICTLQMLNVKQKEVLHQTIGYNQTYSTSMLMYPGQKNWHHLKVSVLQFNGFGMERQHHMKESRQ